MALREQCFLCGEHTIPRRIHGVYLGSPKTLKIWECRECKALWSDKTIIE
jgi:ribosomal protein L37AE/L43A